MRLSLLVFAMLVLAAACSSPFHAPPKTKASAGPGAAATAAEPDANRGATPPPAGRNDQPPPLRREFRGAWVATVDNIDFPSRPGLSALQLRNELDTIVDQARALHLNALVFQVRPAADTFYASPLEPWSEWLTGTQGKAPPNGFDPLAYLIDRCHKNGIWLHAWFNPYRASHPAGKSAPAAGHVRTRAQQIVRTYNKHAWMDPGEALAAKWSLAVIQDVVRRYDVDGVHIDDYFYPYPDDKRSPFPDDASWQKYRADGGKLGRADWRRHNIDDFVQRMYTIVHDEKAWVAVGISPFGIARPGMPKGIAAGIDQFDQLYADVPKWLANGWLDYLSPQLYWPIDRKAQSFATLLPWWRSINPRQRAIWPGLATHTIRAGGKDVRASELQDQIGLLRAGDREPGHVHFSWKHVAANTAQVQGVLRELYREVVLPPAMPWLGESAPEPVQAQVSGRQVTWQADPRTRFVAIQVRDPNGWRTVDVVGGRTAFEVPATALSVALTAIGRAGVASAPCVVAVGP
ncbi:MAG: family 10 glycosylhydrolase [Planctomycetes bacterium]|nr:family 10 glycosylhydrolase [Planctomycetota bacterium]